MLTSKKIARVVCAFAFATALSMTGAWGLYTGQTTGSDVNLRVKAGGNVMTTLPEKTKVAVIEEEGDWYRVATQGMTGYVSRDYIESIPDADFPLGTATITCDTTVNLRLEPNTESEILTSVADGGYVWVTGVKDGWYKVTVGDLSGYMAAPYVYVNSRMANVTSRSEDSKASALRNKVLSFAAKFLGTPYVYGGSTPRGFDCSGFTSYVYKNTVRSIPRTATSQKHALTHVSMSELQPADLVFFGSKGSIGHVGIYVGDGKFIHSPHTGSSIKYDTLWSGNYNRRFVGGARVIFD